MHLLQLASQAIVFAVVKGDVAIFERRVLTGLFAGNENGQ
jgi:hypothetical protein